MSMHPFAKETSQIITALEKAYSEIKEINNPDIGLLQNKILLDIKRHADALKIQLGIEPDFVSPMAQHTGPLKKMFGKDITVRGTAPADVNKPFKQTVEDVQLAELRLKADELTPRFLATPSDQLLDSVTDIEIRAVAKRAGLPVTDTNPKRITVAYIDEIKNAMRLQNSGKETAINDGIDQDTVTKTDPEQQLFLEFQTIENKDIIEVYPDPMIRAIAKRAGLPVTDNTPAKIDVKFITQIKAALKKQKELNDIAGNV